MAKRPKTKPPKTLTAPLKRDGWENALTGLGVFGRDKSIHAVIIPELLSQEVCEQAWRGDDIVARIIETVPNEMLREGFSVVVNNEKELSEEIDEAHKAMRSDEAFRTALFYGRAYGGAGILLGINDGVDPRNIDAYKKWIVNPVREDRIKSVDFLNVLTPRELQPVTYYREPLLPNYGQVETYRVIPIYAPPGATNTGMWPIVHESRILRINGEETTRRAMLTNVQPGWPDSILNRCLRVIASFQQAWQGAGIILQDFAPPTLKLKGLHKLMSMQGQNVDLRERATAIEMGRSIARTTIIDAEEEYERQSVNVTGYADLLSKMADRLAAAAQMPVSLLFGQAPAGLNATGDADIRWFYDQVAAWQKRKLKPVVEQLTRYMCLAKDGPTGGKEPDDWCVNFPRLWQQTDLEQAQVRNTQAQADVAYVNAGILTPEEVAKSRFGGDKWSADTALDEEARGEMGEIIDPETPAEESTEPAEEPGEAPAKT